MQRSYFGQFRVALLSVAMLVSACAGYSGSNLIPRVATLPEVIATMGEPAMRCKDADGSEQLAYRNIGPSLFGGLGRTAAMRNATNA
jgi:hypothetical protein